MAKLGEAYEALSVASSNGGDVDNLVLVFNKILSIVNNEFYDPMNNEASLDVIIEQAGRINERALTESRNELISVAATVVIVIIVELFLWRGFPRVYWNEWLKRRGGWQVK